MLCPLCKSLQATSTAELFKAHSLENYAIVKAKDAEIRRLKRIEAQHTSECRAGGGGEDLRPQVEDLEKQLTKACTFSRFSLTKIL